MAENKQMNSYELSRAWFDWCFENPEKISPNHHAIFFFAIEHCNRLGWKEKFGFPTQMVMDAVGIKKHQTYIRYFLDLCSWGFLNIVERSVNQYSANIISLGFALPKNGKALGKAILSHAAKQTEPMRQSNSSIDKPITINNKQESIISPPDNIFLETDLSEAEVPPVAPPPHPLQNSNLFRQPNVPKLERVKEVFRANGGTDEMAEKFFNKHNAVSWFLNGSPIRNFESLVGGFIEKFREYEKQKHGRKVISIYTEPICAAEYRL